jgi:hypothetical protein
MGIQTGRDLLNFDHRSFWQKRLLFQTVDPDQLGRLIRNRNAGKRSRVSDDTAVRTGHVFVNSVSSIQELIDKYRKLGKLSRILQTIPNEGWLPSSQSECDQVSDNF